MSACGCRGVGNGKGEVLECLLRVALGGRGLCPSVSHMCQSARAWEGGGIGQWVACVAPASRAVCDAGAARGHWLCIKSFVWMFLPGMQRSCELINPLTCTLLLCGTCGTLANDAGCWLRHACCENKQWHRQAAVEPAGTAFTGKPDSSGSSSATLRSAAGGSLRRNHRCSSKRLKPTSPNHSAFSQHLPRGLLLLLQSVCFHASILAAVWCSPAHPPHRVPCRLPQQLGAGCAHSAVARLMAPLQPPLLPAPGAHKCAARVARDVRCATTHTRAHLST